MSKLVVNKRRPLALILAVIVLSIFFSILAWWLLDAAHWNFIKDQLLRSEKTHLLWDANQRLQAENKELRERVVVLERSNQIDNQVAARLQNEIRALQDQSYALKEELTFYQGIMSSATDSKGLTIQGLHVEPTDRKQLYRFKLVLTNVAKSDKVIQVTMDMSVEGINEAGSKVLSLDEITAGNKLKRKIKFKNFGRIEGSLSFPEGFKPLRVVVDLRQKGVQKSTIQKIFQWPASAG